MGNDLIQFYNDAYIPSLGDTGKHPYMLGMGARESWKENWEIISPLSDKIFSEGQSIFMEDQLVPLYRNGKVENAFWTFSYSPLYDEAGKVSGMMVICLETTKKMTKFNNIVMQSVEPIVIFKGKDLVIEEANKAALSLWGLEWSDIGRSFISRFNDPAHKGFVRILLDVFNNGTSHYEMELPVNKEEGGEQVVFYYNFQYTPYREASDSITGVMVMGTDVTVQYAAKKKQEIAEDEVTSAIEAADLGYWNFNFSNRVFTCNVRTKMLFGLDPDTEIEAKTAVRAIYEEDKAWVIEKINKVLKDPTDGSYDIEFRTAYMNDKKGRVIRAKGRCYFDDQHLPIRFSGTLQDITATKRAEIALRQSEEQFRTLANSISQLAWIADKEGWIYWYNDRWYDYTGTTLEEMKGWGWAKVHHPDYLQKIVDFVKVAWKKDEPFELTFPLRRKDGEYRWFLTRAYPVKDGEGNIVHWIGTNTDINDQQEISKALRQSEELLRQISDLMPQIVWASDAKGNYDFFNKKWYEYSGFNFDESMNMGWTRILHPEDYEYSIESWKSAVQTGRNYYVEHRKKGVDGEYRWFLSRANPLKNENGDITRWFGTCTDIQDQKMANDILELKVAARTSELLEANTGLKRMNEELEQFNYAASHDLQEPLRKILLFTERIKMKDFEKLSETSRDLFNKITNAAGRMSNLLKALLDFSSIPKEDHYSLVNLNDIITAVENDLELIIAQKGAVIRKETLPGIYAISLQMQQLFYNLINNALKFTKPGVTPIINIRSRVLSKAEIIDQQMPTGKIYYEFEVSDNGIGFEEEYAEKIFVLFNRLHTRQSYSGSGVGLALCKKVVENHQGKIWATSPVGSGASFHIILPVN